MRVNMKQQLTFAIEELICYEIKCSLSSPLFLVRQCLSCLNGRAATGIQRNWQVVLNIASSAVQNRRPSDPRLRRPPAAYHPSRVSLAPRRSCAELCARSLAAGHVVTARLGW